MATNPTDVFKATRMLFRAFAYLQPRMEGGSLAPPQPMNPEALAGCLLHGCMARLLREVQELRLQGSSCGV